MGRLWTMMADAFTGTWEALRGWLDGLRVEPPASWGPTGWLLAAAVLLLVLTLLFRPRRVRAGRNRLPEVLISLGEIALRPEDGGYTLGMTVSNLNPYSVQLFEVAVWTQPQVAPFLVPAADLLGPSESVDIGGYVDQLLGEEGVIEVYFYAASIRRRFFRLRAGLVWEPWNGRYKVAPLDQRVEVARTPASARAHEIERKAWRRRKEEEARQAEKLREEQAPELEEELQNAFLLDTPYEQPDAGDPEDLLGEDDLEEPELEEPELEEDELEEDEERERLEFPNDF